MSFRFRRNGPHLKILGSHRAGDGEGITPHRALAPARRRPQYQVANIENSLGTVRRTSARLSSRLTTSRPTLLSNVVAFQGPVSAPARAKLRPGRASEAAIRSYTLSRSPTATRESTSVSVSRTHPPPWPIAMCSVLSRRNSVVAKRYEGVDARGSHGWNPASQETYTDQARGNFHKHKRVGCRNLVEHAGQQPAE